MGPVREQAQWECAGTRASAHAKGQKGGAVRAPFGGRAQRGTLGLHPWTPGMLSFLHKWKLVDERYFLFGKYLRRQASKVLPLLAVGEITSNMKNIFHTHQFVLLDRVEEM